jgi:MFS family permease
VGELPEGRRAGPTATLFIARVVYAFNWYNIGAVLPLVGVGLHAGPAQLGIVLGAFLVGVGIFQVPAGFASIRYGARRVCLLGLTVLGLAGVACAFAPNWTDLALLRGVAGVGAAFFFSPALSLIASYYPPGRRGPVIGFYNGGFSVGGAAALVGGAYLGVAYGWPAALGWGGAALLVTTGVAWFLLPRLPAEGVASKLDALWRSGRRVLRSRSIWALSVGLTGFWGALYVVAQDFVNYGVTDHPEWGVGLAASLAAGVVIASFPGGPVGGWLAERGGDRRWLALAFTLVAAAVVLSIPFSPLPLLVPEMIGLGFADGVVFAILYLIPSYLPESQGDGLALGVAVVNSIQVILGSGVAVAFGFIVADYGYAPAWLFTGLLTIALLPLLGLVQGNQRTSVPAPAAPPVGAIPVPPSGR